MATDTPSSFSPPLDTINTDTASQSVQADALADSSFNDDSFISTSSQTQDAEKHPKGKRKRTAAKDKLILEEAYNRNPKPDKQARLDIVQRVSLNEKEVQIWFQNRRQNDRRKSRPLSAEEVASMRYSGANNPFSSAPADASLYGPQQHQHQQQPFSEPPSTDASFFSSPGHAAAGPPVSQQQSTPMHASQESLGQQYPSSAESAATAPVGYLANRWNVGTSFSTPSTGGRHHADDSFRRDDSFTYSPDTSFQSSQSQPNSSNIRLSLSLEGKAELVPALSPERLASTVDVLPPRATLQRSRSAITLPPLSSLMKATGTTTTGRRPSMRGRSRDVAAWVSAAYAEPCDELTALAENESNGSAIAAISLLRSTSGSGVLPMGSSGNSKRNMGASLPRPYYRDGDDDEPAKKRRMLARAASSIARLETTETVANSEDVIETPAKESTHDRLKVARLLSPTDSDKENLSPDEDGNPRSGGLGPRRPLPSITADTTISKSNNPRRTAGRALQENGASLLNARANTAPGGLKRAAGKDIDIFEDAKKVALSPGKRAAGRGGKEDDVDKFMRGSVSPSKKPDMDCVAGLLSLSQGAWR
ncbi:homeobox domain-containing protein [Sarocladium implicatum]|nr:homeobox domain-containing protein [Sarocladium implicatum]